MSEEAPDPDDLRERIEALSDRLEDSTEEAEYRAIEADLEELEAAVDALEETAEDDAPVEELADDLDDLAATLDDERGPYVEDVVAVLESAIGTIESERYTEDGRAGVVAAVETFLEHERFDGITPPTADDEDLAAPVRDARDDLEGADLHPDDDAEAITSLLGVGQALEDAVEAAETWDDLSVREQLQAEGYYDVLDHRKDYPPEWSALKAHERAGNVDMILLALDRLDSEFMTDNALEALKRLGPEAAVDDLMDMAQRRDRQAIEVLGRIGSDEPVDLLLEHLEKGAVRPLETAIIEALGRIGSEDATEALAQQLDVDDAQLRSTAARSLGMIGDTRAIDPLADVLADDADANVRGSAAWALIAIGTERALEVATEHAGDREYLVEVQATRAAEALDLADEPPQA